MYKGNVLFVVIALCGSLCLHAQSFISEQAQPGAVSIVSPTAVATIFTDANDAMTVQKAAAFLQQDIAAVTGKNISISHSIPSSKNIIVIGTIEGSSMIKQLAAQRKIDLGNIKGKWEAYLIQVVAAPFKGVEKALVIAGSDRRGTAYGVAEVSKQIGVSPWYWWADVPVKKKNQLYVRKGTISSDAPLVKYRGIFINDEAPALSGWSKETFGGFNHLFYEKVFELILRLKGNYLWPAMWGNAFYDDDSLSINTADEYGIVIGTSHHEPLMRAHDEWRRYGKGIWNYDSNEVRLKEFWRGGMQRATNEKIVSIGMRGDGDAPMSRETATALLERIVKDQRNIIEQVTGKPAEATPQLWALYKEVQDYYDKGMRVPDDVTLLLCDDNWGNIRKLPKLDEKPRKGGYGIYYHFDYVGGPRNYKWINTNPIPRVWEQMHMAWEYNARQIWIVNVGDIKPMEFPISFFLDYAWNPTRIGADDLQKYTEQWATAQFGDKYAKEIATILSKYSKYNGRRKPELLDANTYSQDNYGEAKRMVSDYVSLLALATKVGAQLPKEYYDAYFQLVLHPVKASSNLHELYYATARNRIAYRARQREANEYADKVKELYLKDSLITLEYHQLRGGKWNHMMDQTHIGYTYWQQPARQKMPTVNYVPADSVVESASLVSEATVITSKPKAPAGWKGNIFFEKDGYVSIAADHYSKAINANGVTWKVLPDLGRTGSSITILPVTATDQTPKAGSAQLQYEIYVYDTGSVKLNAYFSPSLNFHNDEGLKYAISIDNEEPKVISINKDDNNNRTWEQWVANNIIIKTTRHNVTTGAKHVIKYWAVSPGVILQKLVLDFGGMKPSYLGPPETNSE
jgi:hypothetical protein